MPYPELAHISIGVELNTSDTESWEGTSGVAFPDDEHRDYSVDEVTLVGPELCDKIAHELELFAAVLRLQSRETEKEIRGVHGTL